MAPGLAQGGQGIGGFPRLGDGHGENPAVDDRSAIPELRRNIRLDRQPGKRFDQVLSDQCRMPGGAARHETQPVEAGKLSILEPELGDPNVGRLVVHPFAQCVSNGFGLLEDLLEHEVGVPGLLRRLAVPGDAARASPDRNPVECPQGDSVGSQHRQFVLLEDKDLARLSEQGRDV